MSHDNPTIEETLELGPHRPKRRSLWIGAMAFILLAGGVAWWLLAVRTQSTLTYTTAPAVLKDLTLTVAATGNLEPVNTVEVGIEVSGTIAEVHADYNDRVTKGQLLARLDTIKLQSQVDNSEAALAVARANLESAEVSLENARIENERVEKLFASTGGNYPSDKEMDAARATFNSAKADVNGKKALVLQAEAALQSNQDDLRKAVVYSPLEGIVLERSVEVGQTVVASMSTPVLFTIAENLRQMELSVSVDEADIGQVRDGQKVVFSVDAYPKKRFEGEITKVYYNSETVDGVVTYQAIVKVTNDALLLRPGMTATAEIQTREFTQVLTIPNAALRYTPKTPGKPGPGATRTSDTGTRVWVLEAEQPKAVTIVTSESNGNDTIVLEGLSAGMQVVTGDAPR